MNNKNRRSIPLILFLLVSLFALYMMAGRDTSGEQYFEILEKFKKHEVSSFSLNLGSGKLLYNLKDEESFNYKYQYIVPDVDLFISDVKDYIEEYNEENPDQPMEYNYQPPSSFWSTLLSVMPGLMLLGMLAFFYYNMSQRGGGSPFGSVGKAKTKTVQDEGRKAFFSDVAGADEEKMELQELVDFLKNPGSFNMLGASVPKGVLLIGPPGTGKTLLARAVAGEAGVPFFSISGSDFVELYVGVGASRVRDLFDKARKARPSIIFIDEIDAVGRRRGAGLGGGHDEREQTLNQLLVEMDGFGANEGVIVIAATNRADILDPALLRPGRFDREVYVGLPDVKGREEILKVHSKGKPFAPDVNLSTIAKTTPGFTGADLENLLNEAALLAVRNKRKSITQTDIEEASIKVLAGPEKKSKVVTEKERKLTAYHEAGHAVATYFVQPDMPVHQVSIVPRGMAGGFTMSLPSEDQNFVTKNQMINEITSLLGGRVAEDLVLDDVSTGASSDLERATAIARAMVTKYGFSDKMGPIVYDSESSQVFLGRDFTQSRNFSEKVAGDIDSEVRYIIENSYTKCRSVLEENINKLHEVAEALLEFEKIDADSFKKIMENSSNKEHLEKEGLN
ncbi:MAG: ATP-dependent zinc metalloprotease FtsH [Ruminococcaceae bacterium]|nr:ATP-dependent zinc metalloprotease FtsH [Oscillospiraceae bacterium]